MATPGPGLIVANQKGGSGGLGSIPLVTLGDPTYSRVVKSWASWTPPASVTVTGFNVYARKVGATSWTSFGSVASTVTQFAFNDLDAHAKYEFRVAANIQTTIEGIGTESTAEMPSRIIHTAPAILADSSNGMWEDVDPAEGAIGASGRTYALTLRFMGQVPSTPNPFLLYGIRLGLVNESNSPISGAKIIVGRFLESAAADPYWEWIPTDADGAHVNAITENPLAGWATVKRSGSAAIPLPAATADAVGFGFTDWLKFPTPIDWRYNRIIVRVWVPARSVAPYCQTFFNWGDQSYLHFGVLAGKTLAYRRALNTEDDGVVKYFSRFDGDGVTDPTVFTPATATGQSPITPAVWQEQYGPPGPASLPIVAAEYLTEDIA